MTDADLIRDGLQAWAAGDLDALEAVLAPDVSLRSVRPGPWDCADREQVMHLLRQRQREGRNAAPVHVNRVDEHTLIVSAVQPTDDDDPVPRPIATRVTVAGGKVTRMQQFHPEPEHEPAGASE